MFVADRLVFLELQKTGGSHLRRLLEQYTNGSTDGKHNRLDQLPEGKIVVGSIRNPWDWYVSLWAFGVGGKGALRTRISRNIDMEYYRKTLPKAMGRSRLTTSQLINCVYHDFLKPTQQWQQSYRDAEDAQQFRQWLTLLFSPQRRFDIGEGYAFCPLSQHAGLLSYRYFRLFSLGDAIFKDQRLATFEGIADYDRSSNIASAIIRTESLEQDFVDTMQLAGIELSEQQKSSIINKEAEKTNTSKRKPASFYYDEESIALVARGDRYLIEKYGYHPPQI